MERGIIAVMFVLFLFLEELPGTKKERAQAKVMAWWTKNGSRFPSLRSFSEGVLSSIGKGLVLYPVVH